jgi:hypothetical protein
VFTDRECAYIRRSPLHAAVLASDYGVPVETIRAIRNGASS